MCTFVALLTAPLVGCTVDVPTDPASFPNPLNALGDLFENVASGVEDFVEDPLDAGYYPVLVGGDSEKVLYATNLGDVRFRFPGRTNDLVLPGLVGPSNLYRYQNRERRMIQALVPAGTFGWLATDGTYFGYVAFSETDPPLPQRVMIGAIGETATLAYDAAERGSEAYVSSLLIDEGVAVFYVGGLEDGTAVLRVQDLTGALEARELEVDDRTVFDLRARRLVYEAAGDGVRELRLRDLDGDEEIVLASLAADGASYLGGVFLTDNKVVWSETSADFTTVRIVAYDIPSGETVVWADAVPGWLAGAADGHFLIEEYFTAGNNVTNRIRLRLHEVGGRIRELANFRADGLAGQAHILGNRVVFVNDERRVVTVPLGRGERRSFAPY